MDGNGALYGTVQGSTKEVLHSFTVDLPKKHGRGGQSALRFARLRLEKRHNYIRKVAENAVLMFITNDKPNVTGLILAGNADFKNDLAASDMFDQRLAAKILKIVDVSYGGENGFQQAIELASECLSNVKFVHEKKIIKKFFDEVAHDTGKYVYGVQDTIQALEGGMIELLIIYEALDIIRVVLKNPSTGVETVKLLNADEENKEEHYKEGGVELDVVDKLPLIEWIINNYQNYGSALDFVTNKSQEGSQFHSGFGGIGGILRYKMDMNEYGEVYSDDGEFM